jgi:pimeloyl-ACP methyl ester carboxylesterase
MKQVQLANGVKLAYYELGNPSFPTLIGVHGLNSNATTWDDMLPHLCESYYCILLDLPGHGNTASGPYDYSIPFFAECIVHLTQYLGISSFSMLGHSMGGQISIYFTYYNQDRVKELILVAPAGIETFDEKEQKRIRQSLSLSMLSSNLLKSFLPVDRHVRKEQVRKSEIISSCIKGMLNYPVLKYLKGIKIPVLIIFGEADEYIPNPVHPKVTIDEVASQGAKSISTGWVKVIKKEGHFVHETAPYTIISLIRRFHNSIKIV